MQEALNKLITWLVKQSTETVLLVAILTFAAYSIRTLIPEHLAQIHQGYVEIQKMNNVQLEAVGQRIDALTQELRSQNETIRTILRLDSRTQGKPTNHPKTEEDQGINGNSNPAKNPKGTQTGFHVPTWELQVQPDTNINFCDSTVHLQPLHWRIFSHNCNSF